MPQVLLRPTPSNGLKAIYFMTFGFYFDDHPALGSNKLGFFQVCCFLAAMSQL
ncbi:hypothetical protein OAE06_00590 [bacterium]|nr:hypothetical protein [bacterium]